MAKTRIIEIGRHQWAIGFDWHYFEGRQRQAVQAACNLGVESGPGGESGQGHDAAGEARDEPLDGGDGDDFDPGSGIGDDDDPAEAGAPSGSGGSHSEGQNEPDCYVAASFASGFQVGLGRVDGRPGKSFSLAAALAAHPDGARWAARIPLESGEVYVIAIRNGEIMPEGGDFVGSADDADLVFDDLVSEAGDDEWDAIHTFDSADEAITAIEEWLGDVRPTGRVRAMSMEIPKGKVILACVGLVILVGGGYGYMEYLEYKAEQARQERIARQKAKMENQGPQPLPFEDAPTASAVMQMCLDHVERQKMAVHGWSLSSWHCTPNGMRAVWNRESGQFTRRPPGSSFDPNKPNQAVQTAPAPTLDPRGDPGYLPPKLGFSYLLDIARALRLQSSVEAPTPNSPPPGGQRPPPVDELEFEFTTDVRPSERAGQVLSGVPGLVIEGVHWNVGDNQWRIEGMFYVDY